MKKNILTCLFVVLTCLAAFAEHPMLTGEQSENTCGRCHFTNSKAVAAQDHKKIYRELWLKSAHHQMGFSCLDCHDPHKIKNIKLLKANSVKWTCYVCHGDKKKTFEKSLHGKNGVECADCHQPHGSNNEPLLKNDEPGSYFCQTCHENEPHHFIANKITKKMESLRCLNCHKSHYAQKKFLKYKKEDLCVNCHKDAY
ncbi:cytochrome c3 family protein [Candidatus Saganbacteria bacterium]|nr:cytochrome c3 family protein [Candidatus Saganbacteria bacterium]